MVGQYYLERYYSRGASRKLTTKQLEALAKAQQIGEAGHEVTAHDQPMVKAEQVCKSFGALQVLKGITLEVGKGEVLVMVGPSGSGKSTFLRCINHLEQVNAGRLYVDGDLIGYRDRGDKLLRDVAPRRRQAAPRHRHGVPALQPLPASHRAGEHHRGADPRQGRQEGRRCGAGKGSAGSSGAGGKGHRLSGAAVRRPAAARGDRPRAGDEPQADAVRRADLGARPGAGRRGARGDEKACRTKA